MFQAPDYTILDHLTEICEVVGFDYHYVYVNDAAAKKEHLSKGEMTGHSLLELHPGIETTLLFLHLRECLEERKTIEFEDESSKQRTNINPVPEGAFIHSAKLPMHKTKVKIRSDTMITYDRLIREQAGDLEIEGWLDALDARTCETNDHILRVTEATVTLARMAGIPGNEIIQIRHGALFHDIGKIGIPDSILLKSSGLNDDEWEIIRRHPIYAHDLFHSIDHLKDCLSIPYSHHEKWNGTGYPEGLKREEIPLAARLFAVVDVWDTLSFDRVYRKAWPREKVLAYIQEQAGSHFDPDVVDLFIRATKDILKPDL